MDFRDKIIIAILIFFVGMGAGYWWRMEQTENGFKKQIEQVEIQRKEMYRDLLELEIRIRVAEKKMGLK